MYRGSGDWLVRRCILLCLELWWILWTHPDWERSDVSSVYLVIDTELRQNNEYRIGTQISRLHSLVVNAADCRSTGPWLNPGWRTLFTFVTWYDRLTNEDFLMINIMSPIITSIRTTSRMSAKMVAELVDVTVHWIFDTLKSDTCWNECNMNDEQQATTPTASSVVQPTPFTVELDNVMALWTVLGIGHSLEGNLVVTKVLYAVALKIPSRCRAYAVEDWMQWSGVPIVAGVFTDGRMSGRLIGESLDRREYPTSLLGLYSQVQTQEQYIQLHEDQLTTDTVDLVMKDEVLAEGTAVFEDITQDRLVCQTTFVEFKTYTNKSLYEGLETFAKAKAGIYEKTDDAEYQDEDGWVFGVESHEGAISDQFVGATAVSNQGNPGTRFKQMVDSGSTVPYFKKCTSRGKCWLNTMTRGRLYFLGATVASGQLRQQGTYPIRCRYEHNLTFPTWRTSGDVAPLDGEQNRVTFPTWRTSGDVAPVDGDEEMAPAEEAAGAAPVDVAADADPANDQEDPEADGGPDDNVSLAPTDPEAPPMSVGQWAQHNEPTEAEKIAQVGATKATRAWRRRLRVWTWSDCVRRCGREDPHRRQDLEEGKPMSIVQHDYFFFKAEKEDVLCRAISAIDLVYNHTMVLECEFRGLSDQAVLKQLRECLESLGFERAQVQGDSEGTLGNVFDVAIHGLPGWTWRQSLLKDKPAHGRVERFHTTLEGLIRTWCSSSSSAAKWWTMEDVFVWVDFCSIHRPSPRCSLSPSTASQPMPTWGCFVSFAQVVQGGAVCACCAQRLREHVARFGRRRGCARGSWLARELGPLRARQRAFVLSRAARGNGAVRSRSAAHSDPGAVRGDVRLQIRSGSRRGSQHDESWGDGTPTVCDS